jgi:hypothetical protein
MAVNQFLFITRSKSGQAQPPTQQVTARRRSAILAGREKAKKFQLEPQNWSAKSRTRKIRCAAPAPEHKAEQQTGTLE